MNRTLRWAGLALVIAGLAACGESDEAAAPEPAPPPATEAAPDARSSAEGAPPATPPSQPIGKPNPASEYCLSRGGQHYLKTGICRLPDGREVDVWEYYRENVDPGE